MTETLTENDKTIPKGTPEKPPPATPKSPQRAKTASTKPPELPSPPSRKIRDAAKFFKYWNDVAEQFPDRTIVYLYRLWPVIDRVRLGKDKYIDVLGKPFKDVQALYDAWGCGDYQLYLNDSTRKITVCQVVITGYRNFEESPPVIEVEDVVRDDTANRSWIERTKLRGVQFPGEEVEDEEMTTTGQSGGVTSGALAALTNILERQSNQLMNLSQRLGNRDEGAGSKVTAAAVDTIIQGSKERDRIIGSAYEDAHKVRSAAAQPPSGVDLFTALMGAVKELVPKQPAAPAAPAIDVPALMTALAALNKPPDNSQVIGFYQTQLASMEKRLDAIMSQQTTTVPPKDPIEEFARITSALDNIRGSSASAVASNPETPWWGNLIQLGITAMPLITNMVGAVSAAIYNSAVAKQGGAPVPPPAPVTEADMAQSAQAAAGMLGASGAPPDGSSPTQIEENAHMQLLDRLQGPLITHLSNPDLTGFDFADWLISSDPNGGMLYSALREMGKDQLINLLRKHKILWDQLRPIPGKLNTFLDQFLHAGDPQPDEEDEIPAPEPQAVSPPPAPISVASTQTRPTPVSTPAPTPKTPHKTKSNSAKKGVS